MTSNFSLSFPARTVESTTDTYGTFHVSNTQRVHPSSIGAAYERYSPTRGASGPAKPGYPGFAAGGSTGAERAKRSESRAATAVTPISNGSVWAVTSYGGRGGPPGYSRRSGYRCGSSSVLANAAYGCRSTTT